jgi:hypothetical protein
VRVLVELLLGGDDVVYVYVIGCVIGFLFLEFKRLSLFFSRL